MAILAHIGNFEAIAVYAQREKVAFKAIVKLLHNPLINREVLALRRAAGMDVIPASANMKAAVDAIKHGEWVGVLGDQNSRRAGVYVEFFGKPASTFAGAALFAHRMDVPILPIFTVREPGPLRKPHIVVCPVITPNPTAPKDDEVLRLTRAHVAALEQVGRAPSRGLLVVPPPLARRQAAAREGRRTRAPAERTGRERQAFARTWLERTNAAANP